MSAGIKGGVTSLACAACGADMVCSEHGLSLPCDMCAAESAEPSLMCNRCGGTVSRKVSETERLEMLGKASDPQAAKFKSLLRRAEDGDVAAQYAVALMYRNGDGVAASETVAIKWLRAAAEGGQADAQLVLAQACLHGDGVRKNTPEAVKWFRKAARASPSAQYQLGMLLYEGSGSVKQDLKEANDWMTKAAQSGLADAQYQLGLHSVGETAKSWLQKASNQGHKEASERLAEIQEAELIRMGIDPLYDKAVELVLRTWRPSPSLIQRHLRIGYSRAARLLERMETEGIVSGIQSDGIRIILNKRDTPPGTSGKPEKPGDKPEKSGDKPAETKLTGTVFTTVANVLALLLTVGLLWYLVNGFILLLIIGLLWYFVGLERLLRGIDRLLDILIERSAAYWFLIAEKLRNFANLAKDRFAVHTPSSFPIKRIAVGLILTAGVLWFFVGMVKDHFGTARFNGRQPVLVAAQQADVKQQSPRNARPQQKTVVEAPVVQDTTPQPIVWQNSSFPRGALVAENKVDAVPSETSSEGGQVITAPISAGDAPGGEMIPDPMISAAKVVGDTPSASAGWIGVGIRALSPGFIHSMGLAYGQGILISEVPDIGPAARAGVAVGDILISVDGKNVGAENVKEVISGLPPGKVVRIEVLRNDTRRLLTVRVEPRP